MGRSGISYIDVSKAAQELIAQGKAPTIETIRMRLGTGSNSTIGTYFRTWKENQNQTQQIASKENIPNELIAVVKGLWERIMMQSEEKIQILQQTNQEEVAKLKQEVLNFGQENARLQQQYHQIKQERDGLINEKSVFEQLIVNSNLEMVAINEKLAGLVLQLQEKQTRIDELHRQNQANLEHYRAASLEQRLIEQQRYEQQQGQLEQTIHQTRQELMQIGLEKMELQRHNQKFQIENEHIKNQLDKLNIQHDSITVKL